MARSLTVTHDERPSTSPLFTGFLLLSAAWLAAHALFGTGAEAAPSPADHVVAAPWGGQTR